MNRVAKLLSAGMITGSFVVAAAAAGATGASASTFKPVTPPKPAVTSLSPTHGPTTGGTLVTIYGSHFMTAGHPITAVDFGNPAGNCNAVPANPCQATNVTVVSNGVITATSPPGYAAGSYNVFVTNNLGTSNAVTGDQFTYKYAGKFKINNGNPLANLSLTTASSVSASGTGFTEGDTVVVTICSADASLPDPLTEGLGPFSACAQLSGANLPTVSAAGAWSTSVPLVPGSQGTLAASECPQSITQGQEGTVCIVGAAVEAGPDAGKTDYAAIYFAPPALTSSDTYLTETTADTPSTAVYSVTLTETGTHGQSNDPPVVTASGIPNNGGFASAGIECAAGTGPGTGNPCSVVYSSPGVPATCQAASSPGATAWLGQTLCTYGVAVGEPVELLLTKYVGTGTPPVPVSATTPFNCTATGCSVSANAGYGVSDPGGFSATAQYWNGTAYATVPFGPGTYSFQAKGLSSGQTSKVNVTLLPGPSS
jgi:hypothetical protein